MFNTVLEDFEQEINEAKITLSVNVIKDIAKQLGMTDIEEDARILAAIDDYFKTLNDGQYSPMSGEHNNASNSTEVYHIAKKHSVDPSHIMRYLSDIAIFDKFQKMAISENIKLDEINVISPKVKANIKDKFMGVVAKKAYTKHVDAAIDTYLHELESGREPETLAYKIANTYGLNPDIFADKISQATGTVNEPRPKYSYSEFDESKNSDSVIQQKGLSKYLNEYEALVEGKQQSVYEVYLTNFLDEMSIPYEQSSDGIFTEDAISFKIREKFPEFKGMIRPLSEFKSDVYITMDDTPKEIYKGIKGVG